MEYNSQHEDLQLQYVNPDTAVSLRRFMARVFAWMTAALALTGIVAYLVAHSPALLMSMVDESGLNFFGWIVMLAPLGFVLLMSFGVHKLSAPVMMILFIVYSLIMGMSFSFIFLVYDLGAIYKTFAITAGVFGLMAVLGYTTKVDLSKFGSILLIALVGIIIASIVNWFMKSPGLDYIISIAGVLIFTGLTAWDVQKLKRIGQGIEDANASASKLAILGALSLYLDFINLFLFLLRIVGGRK